MSLHSSSIIRYVVVLRNFRSEMTVDQLSALDSLDHSLSELTKEAPTTGLMKRFAHLTGGEAFGRLPRRLSIAFNWPNETPPSHADEYVGK